MKENYFDEESWSEKFINAREKDKMTIFNKVMDELEPLTDAFLDKADEVIKEETHNERLFFIGERDFTEKMNDFFYDNQDEFFQLEDGLDDDIIYTRLSNNLKLVIAIETNSGSEIPIAGIAVYPNIDENNKSFMSVWLLFFDVPKKYIRSKDSPVESLEGFINSESFQDLIMSEPTFSLIRANSAANMMYDVIKLNGYNDVLLRFGLDGISDLKRSKDVIIAKNALVCSISLNAIGEFIEDYLKQNIRGISNIELDSDSINIELSDSEEIQIDFTKDMPVLISSLSKKRTEKIITREIYNEICDYNNTKDVLWNYMKDISKIGKERGIITVEDSIVKINFGKFGKEFIKDLSDKEIQNISPAKSVEIIEDYISAHPKLYEFNDKKKKK